jgi:hypothetical protein
LEGRGDPCSSDFLKDRVPLVDIWPEEELPWGGIFANAKTISAQVLFCLDHQLTAQAFDPRATLHLQATPKTSL